MFLIPVNRLTSSYARTGNGNPKPEHLRQIHRHASIFARNFGGLDFSGGEEFTALGCFVVLSNISIYLVGEIDKGDLSVENARKMTVAFGEAVNSHLSKIKPRKHVKVKRST